jgi:uncharacterized membrane protein
MVRKLFAIMTVGGAGTLVFGLWLSTSFAPALRDAGWLHTKPVLVRGLVAVHACCWKLVLGLRSARNRHGERFYRFINEVLALGLEGGLVPGAGIPSRVAA